MEKSDNKNIEQGHPHDLEIHPNDVVHNSPLKIDTSNNDDVDEDSFFSNEEHSVGENNDPNTPAKKNEAEILKLADQADELKISRQTLMFKYNSSFKEMPKIPEENHEHPSTEAEPHLNKESFQSEDSTPSCGNVSHSETIDKSPDSKTTQQSTSSTSKSCSDLETTTKTFTQKTAENVSASSSIIKALEKQPNQLPAVEGFLKKQRPGLLHIWQKRYVILMNKKLIYYKDKTLEKFCGCIDFDLVPLKIEVCLKDPRTFLIIPDGGNRTFSFRADNENLAKMWTDALAIHVEMSSAAAKLTPQKSIVSKKNYWKNDRISEQKFLSEVKTGDILLFRSESFAAKLQRSVTRSEYDHVALLLKLSDRNIVLFEATGNSGVALCRWTTFKRNEWHNLYSKVVYRKLVFERTDEFIGKIEKFVKTNVGNKYAVNAKKLMQRKSTSIGTEGLSDRTYFCSELVAACYKRSDILPSDISSSRYLPCSFSAARKMPFLKGAKLDREMLIDFNI